MTWWQYFFARVTIKEKVFTVQKHGVVVKTRRRTLNWWQRWQAASVARGMRIMYLAFRTRQLWRP